MLGRVVAGGVAIVLLAGRAALAAEPSPADLAASSSEARPRRL
jgi:hypothetical protein